MVTVGNRVMYWYLCFYGIMCSPTTIISVKYCQYCMQVTHIFLSKGQYIVIWQLLWWDTEIVLCAACLWRVEGASSYIFLQNELKKVL
jgi:hypothetical protein